MRATGEQVRRRRGRRRVGLTALGALSFVLVLTGGLTGGLGGGLVMLGLPLLLVGLGATVVGRARWALITSRRVGAAVLMTGLVTMMLGGAVLPEPRTEPVAQQAPRDVQPMAQPKPAPTPRATSAGPTASASPADHVAPAPPGTALALLGTLDVKGRAPKTGYDRDLFGQRWADTDRNGCDTRNDILRRDLDEIVLKSGTNGCVVLSGTYVEPYSGRPVAFERGQGTSELVQIDHVVALSDAWQKGAQQWTPERRLAFANDPLNLLAVDGSLNMQKGDGDAATWLPPNRAIRCEYVARQVAVKAKYAAWVTAAERDAIARVLSSCPDQGVPTSEAPVEATIAAAPPPTPQQAPPPPPPASGGAWCDPSYPGVCIPPYAEVGDLDCGDVPHVGFAVHPPDPHAFDGNRDGEGCEG